MFPTLPNINLCLKATLPTGNTSKVEGSQEMTEDAMVHGTLPQFLIEKILRLKIYETKYWKEKCFGVTALELVDRAVELRYIGGTYGGNQKPTNFMCLLFKMLQITPEMEIVESFINFPDFKYIRVLGVFYLRLVGSARDIYTMIEPLLADFRKIRVRNPDGSFSITHIDEIAHALLTENFVFSVSLPAITSRQVLEDKGVLEPRKSKLFDIDPDLEQLLHHSSQAIVKGGLTEHDQLAESSELDSSSLETKKKKLKKVWVGKKKSQAASTEPNLDDLDQVNARR